MKIYKLIINKVAPDPIHAISSNFVNQRTKISETFYMKEVDAKIESDRKYKAAFDLFGIQHGLEVLITEVDVIE